jgi:hypothetical protein
MGRYRHEKKHLENVVSKELDLDYHWDDILPPTLKREQLNGNWNDRLQNLSTQIRDRKARARLERTGK